MSLSEQLADYIWNLDYGCLPEAVRDIAVSAVYNYMGCAVAGVKEEAPTVVLRTIKSAFPAGPCRLIGTAETTDPASAALFNGTAGNAIGFDDMFKGAIYHPGVPAITAALAAADLVRPSGKRFLEAVVAGYEVANRIGMTVSPSHYTFWHTAATVGSFGACAAAGKVLGLSQTELVNAIGAAGDAAAGLQECSGNMAQRLHLGMAARNGVLAALLAQNGYDGPKHILEGPAGFIAAESDYTGAPEEHFQDLGSRYTILDTTFKFYPCCGHIHACIDAALFAMEKSGFSLEELKKIEVGTYQTAIGNSGHPHPENRQQAKFSIPYCVAAAVLYGQVTMEEFASWPPEPALAALMEKVELRVDDACEANFPLGKRGATVTLVTEKDRFTEVRHSRRGDPDCPLTRAEIRAKFMALTGNRERLAERIEQLPTLEDASVLLDDIE